MCFNNSRIQEFIQQGEFSFINSSFLRLALEHDYKYVYPIMLGIDLRNVDSYFNSNNNSNNNIWDSPPGDKWNEILYLSYQFHSAETYKYSMKTMKYIIRFGWNRYLNDYLSGQLPFKLK
jgi:hypothetical protein